MMVFLISERRTITSQSTLFIMLGCSQCFLCVKHNKAVGERRFIAEEKKTVPVGGIIPDPPKTTNGWVMKAPAKLSCKKDPAEPGSI